MPKDFLTNAQRERLNQFPDDLPRDDLSAYFTLSGADIEIIKRQRYEHTQLGFALRICTLRYLGIVLRLWEHNARCSNHVYCAPA